MNFQGPSGGRSALQKRNPCVGLEIPSSCGVVQEGAVIGDRFEVGPLAGKGSMGAVFRAYDRAAGKPVAIKVLSQHDADAVRRFDHEARVLAELAHPHIVQHVAHGAMANGTPYLVMEWLEGQSLAARLKQSRLVAADALELAQHIASALAAAHTRGIVHRDIKPSNIFLVNGSVHASRVLDFGVAQVANAGPRQTRTGGVVGTPGYMAPEQIQGSRERATPRVDIFSLGALLFECLTGRRAFEGDDVMAILARVLREEAPRVRSVLPDVPEELDTLVAQMLSRVPEARPANGTQVHRALQQVGRRISTHVHDEPRGSRLRIELETRLLGIILAAPIEEAAERQSAPTLRTNVSPAQGEKLQQLAMRHGGLATEFAGGGLLVRVLGTDALVTRAARCALAAAKVLEGFRIALVVGCADDGRDLPHAELIGRAIQLLQYSDRHKASHGVRLDATTAALLDAHFSIMGPSHAPRLCHEQSDFGTPRLLFDKPPPFTGRKREIDTLVDFLTEALDEGDAATALVVAHAGMGKSRLGREALVELRQRIPHLSVAIARAVPTELPHSLVRDLVRHVLQLGPETPQELIHAAMQNTLPDARTATIDMLTRFFAEPTESSEALPWAPMEHARQAWLELLGALARGRSMLLVLEDAQWADDASMELLQDALAQVDMHPFGVLALARPEIRERGFGLFHRRDVQEMRLGPLSPKMSTTFVSTFLPENSNLSETIVLASEGHPMFLEELIRTSNPDTTPQISCAVLLAAHGPQFARIAEDELQALRLASLVGLTFWIGAVKALHAEPETEGELRHRFDQLVTSGIIARRRMSRISHDVEYMFAQASMRHALLATWTEDDRRIGQALAKTWLQERGML